MEIGKIIIIIILAILVAVGVTCIFNAREITKKFFSSTNQNQVVSILKIVGSVMSIGSAIGIILMNK